MSPPIDLYYFATSPPARAVRMVLDELGVDYKIHVINLGKREQRSEEYKKIIWNGKVPAIRDGDLAMSESRAINAYLVGKYGAHKQDLYPTDLVKRAKVDEHLYISLSLFVPIGEFSCVGPVIFMGGSPNYNKLQGAKDAFAYVEKSLRLHTYTAADHLTLADFSYFSLICGVKPVEFNWDEYPKVCEWMKKMEDLPSYKKGVKEDVDTMVRQYAEKLKESKSGNTK